MRSIPTEPHAAERRASVTDRLAASVARTTVFGHRLDDIVAGLRRRAVPTHWTNLLGIVTLACVVVVTVTGLWLMLFYTPSSAATTYDGGYAPLHGAEVSHAFASTMQITFEVPGGLLMRQAHHWAALLLPAAIIMQLLVAFFTGAFRRPRRGMWVLLFLIFIAALAGGWSGYALPDDMLSGTGLRITEGIAWGWRVVSSPEPFTGGRPESERGNDKVVIVLTDGYTPWPSEPSSARVVAALIGDAPPEPPAWIESVHVTS
jgi:ubiquinol-cytochrome c reductase cytochrome b subunit